MCSHLRLIIVGDLWSNYWKITYDYCTQSTFHNNGVTWPTKQMGGQFFMSYDKGFQNKLPLADKYWYPNCCPICILGGVTQLQSTDSVPFLVRYHILVAWNLDEDGVRTLQPCTSPQNSSNWYELIRFMDIHGMFVKKNEYNFSIGSHKPLILPTPVLHFLQVPPAPAPLPESPTHPRGKSAGKKLNGPMAMSKWHWSLGIYPLVMSK